MRLDHPIFTTPLRATIETSPIVTPKNYDAYEAGLPAKLDAWKVQDGKLADTVDYGLVSSPYGFEDSPDAEWISSGVNSKGPRSLALGRQGNWFLWGFAGDPTQMTPSARQVFLNTLVWMKQFDGKAPVVALSRARSFASEKAGPVETVARTPSRDEAFVKVNLLRKYAKDAGMSAYARSQFSDELWKSTNGDPDAIEQHYRENLEFVRAAKVPREFESEGPDGKPQKTSYEADVLEVDLLLADLGVSNRKPEFFDEYERLLGERGADDATVKELARYLPPDAPREAAAFESWLAQHRERLFFSDVFSYRWYVAPEGMPPRPTVDRAVEPKPAAAPAPSAQGGG